MDSNQITNTINSIQYQQFLDNLLDPRITIIPRGNHRPRFVPPRPQEMPQPPSQPPSTPSLMPQTMDIGTSEFAEEERPVVLPQLLVEHRSLSSQDEERDCSICLDMTQREHEVSETVCGHIFHRSCLQRWTATTPSCPLCRRHLLL